MKLNREVRSMLALMICAGIAYFTALWGDFVYDDLHSVRDNTAIRSLSNLPLFFHDLTSFSSLDVKMYRPVLLASFAFDFALSGLSPWAFKLGNIVIHAGCAALLYSLARRLRASHLPALLAGMFFAVHPLASEAVNMISSRSDQLMVFGLLMGMRCHLEAMAGSRWGLLGTMLAACIACGSKETGVILPVCLLILEGL
ncbi:MAG: glycosyltransferase family 39 protein, partial [Planctomycetota bacterium]